MTQSTHIVFPKQKIAYREGGIEHLYIVVARDNEDTGFLLPIFATDALLAGIIAKKDVDKVLFVVEMRDLLQKLNQVLNEEAK